jgi:hypothetical protein
MSHLRKRLLAPGISFFLLVVILIVSAETKTAAAAPAGNRVVVLLTLDPQTNKVTANPDPVALHYGKKDYADWQIDKGSAAFDFTIGMEDQTDPNKRKPAKKLPVPICSGKGAAKHCASIVPTADHTGDHKYSVTVKTPGGPVKTDPEVTIDP